MMDVKVKPKLKAHATELPTVCLIVVCDWEVVRPPAITGLAALMRERLIAGEHFVVVQGLHLPAGVDEVALGGLPGLRLPVDRTLASLDQVAWQLLRTTLVGRLVAEGIPAVELSGVDLGMLRRDEDGDLRVDSGRLGWLLSSGVVPVLGGSCLLPNGNIARATAGDVTYALAGSKHIAGVDIVTHTQRIREPDGLEAVSLRVSDLERLRTRGPEHLPAEPAPKAAIEAALTALKRGVPVARIGSVSSLADGTATKITNEQKERA